ncbi:MAG: hypothetical protein NVS4B3_04420 [Gemmatimonadaceae bacterium]
METILVIRGMTTVHCVRAVFTALAGVEGIASATVERGQATVQHDGRPTATALSAAVAVAGYEVVEIRGPRRRLPVV